MGSVTFVGELLRARPPPSLGAAYFLPSTTCLPMVHISMFELGTSCGLASVDKWKAILFATSDVDGGAHAAIYHVHLENVALRGFL